MTYIFQKMSKAVAQYGDTLSVTKASADFNTA